MRHAGLDIRAPGAPHRKVEIIDGKPGGIAVSIGARIAAEAAPLRVLVSQTVKDVVVGSGLSFEERGVRTQGRARSMATLRGSRHHQ